MDEIISQTPSHQVIILISLLALLIIQLIYWLGYNMLAKHRHRHRLQDDSPLPPVSVIVVVQDDPDYVYQELPRLLTQDHPQYEVVVVNDCGGSEVTEALMAMSQKHPQLRYTVIKTDDRFKHSRKIPLVVGIKAAQYDNLIFTHTDTYPTSDRWLSFMAKGFVGSDIVIGYAGYESKTALLARMVRATNMESSIRFLSAATRGHTYRGTMRNIGYTKQIFFAKRGFTHLRLALGEDDLLIQKIATPYNTAVIINPHCTVRATLPNTRKNWRAERRFFTYPFRYYPARVKINIFTELFSRALFFITCSITITASIVAITPLNIITTDMMAFPIATLSIAGGMYMIREITMIQALRNICGRLGEKGFIFAFIMRDKIAPLSETLLALRRRIKPPHGLWK